MVSRSASRSHNPPRPRRGLVQRWLSARIATTCCARIAASLSDPGRKRWGNAALRQSPRRHSEPTDLARISSAVKGRPLRLDPNAEAADPGPASFPQPTRGAPVYFGFPVLDDVDVDGFRLGMITDWEAEPADRGDAFVVASDGARAGLDWEVHPEPKIEQVLEPNETRWGVWYVRFPHAMTSRANARRNLAAVLPFLRPRWELWPHRS